LQNTSIVKKWIIFLLVIPLGVAGNTLRIFLTGCIAHYVGIKYAEGFFHEISGGVVFIFTIVGLIAITDLMMRRANANK
jgi:exosortase/archaeosortase family protein